MEQSDLEKFKAAADLAREATQSNVVITQLSFLEREIERIYGLIHVLIEKGDQAECEIQLRSLGQFRVALMDALGRLTQKKIPRGINVARDPGRCTNAKRESLAIFLDQQTSPWIPSPFLTGEK
jgi:hypothetical protein